METFNTAMLLSKANELWDQMEEEGESMDRADFWEMMQDESQDLECQRIEKILPRTRPGTNEVDMMNWLIFTLKLRLAWIRKWKARRLRNE